MIRVGRIMERIIVYAIIYIVQGMIAYFYLSRMFVQRKNNRFAFLCYFFTYFVQYITFFFNIVLLNVTMFLIMNFLLILLCYKTNVFNALFNSLIMTCFMSLSEYCILNFIGGIIQTTTDVLDLGYPQIIIFFISNKFLYWLLLYIVTKITDFSNKKIIIDNSTILLTLFPIFSFIMFIILHIINISNSLTRVSEYLFVVIDFFLILCNVFIIWLYDYNLSQHDMLTKLKLEHQHRKDAENYDKLMTQHNENQKILIHDIKNHLQTIYSLNMDKNYKQANSYLSNLLNAPVLTHTYEPTNSHNLNLLLSRYIKICDDKNITFNINARNTDISYMKLEDVTALFCNLIDNAIEAAEKTEHAHISLHIQDSENNTRTVITVINSSSQAPVIENNHFRTLKPDPYMHGIGTYSLQRVIDKYNGDSETYYLEDEKEFHAVILLLHKEV